MNISTKKRRRNIRLREFGAAGWVLSSDNVLLAAGTSTRLPPRLARLLRALVAGRGRSVSKPDLLDSVWGRHQGSDQRLAKAVSDLRRVFQRHGVGQIESVYGSGYRLVPRDEHNSRLLLRDKVQALCAEASYRVHERDRDSLRIAEKLYTIALELDPRCRDANLGLAGTQLHGVQNGFWSAKPAWLIARKHLDAVRQIDPDSLMLYVLLSLGIGLIEDDPVAACALQSDIRRCNRGALVGHPVPSYLHLASGRPERAVEDIQVALERDPASAAALALMPYALLCAGKHAGALRATATSLAADPTIPAIQALCGWVEATIGDPQDAAKLTSMAHKARPASSHFAAIHAYALARIGNREAAIRVLHQNLGREDGIAPATSMAAIAWVALGQHDKAIGSLRHAADERCFWRRIVYHDPRLEALRDEPTVRALFDGDQMSERWAAVD